MTVIKALAGQLLGLRVPQVPEIQGSTKRALSGFNKPWKIQPRGWKIEANFDFQVCKKWVLVPTTDQNPNPRI